MGLTELSIIIVNYNTVQLTLNCLSSIYKFNKKINFEIIVIDNCSSDDSCEKIEAFFPQVVLVKQKSNEGFGRANNQGIEIARSNNILLLNSDTILLDNALEKIHLKLIHESNNFGMATCQLLNQDGTKQKSIFNYNASFFELLSYNVILNKLFDIQTKIMSNKEISALSGACLIFKKDKIKQVGFFDPDFFMYSEEFEWCNRIKRNNLTLKIYDDIEIIHLDGGSSTGLKIWNVKQRYISNALLFKKVRGNFGLLLYFFLHLFNTCSNFLILWRMTDSYRANYYQSQWLFWSQFPQYLNILFGRYDKPLRIKSYIEKVK